MAKLTEYQTLRRAGLCTRNCGRKGEASSHGKSSKRRSECKQCRENSHGKK